MRTIFSYMSGLFAAFTDGVLMSIDFFLEVPNWSYTMLININEIAIILLIFLILDSTIIAFKIVIL